MNKITRTTRACTMETLNGSLKAAIHTHGLKYGLDDIESDVLICCETVSVNRKSGWFNGNRTTLAAAFITPKWLVWAQGDADQKHASAGSALLKNIDVRDFQTTASHAVSPDQGLNVTGRYTDRNRTGITFIGLSTEPDGQRFRQVLEAALNRK